MHATFEELPLNDLDKAWCAGLLEGEGSFWVTKYSKLDGSFGYSAQLQMAMNQRDRDVVEKLHSLLGGSVNGPYKPKKNHPGQGEMITWGLYRKENALKVIKTLYPLLGKRRQEQCQKVWKNLTGVDYAQ